GDTEIEGVLTVTLSSSDTTTKGVYGTEAEGVAGGTGVGGSRPLSPTAVQPMTTSKGRGMGGSGSKDSGYKGLSKADLYSSVASGLTEGEGEGGEGWSVGGGWTKGSSPTASSAPVSSGPSLADIKSFATKATDVTFSVERSASEASGVDLTVDSGVALTLTDDS
ncbi:hypothetical protein KIPB_016064, partial [Kipferlia bialata]